MANIEDSAEQRNRSNQIDNDDSNVMNFSAQEEQLKKEKAKAKSNFTRCRHRLQRIIDDEDLPSRRVVKEVCEKFDSCMEIATGVMLRLSDLYSKYNESEKCKFIISELEKAESEFSAANESAHEYLESRRDDKSSVTSETLQIDMLREMKITDNEAHQYTGTPEVRFRDIGKNIGHTPNLNNMHDQSPNTQSSHWDNSDVQFLAANLRLPRVPTTQNTFNPTAIRANTVPLATGTMPSIGRDLWKQLKRVEIPVFSGDKRTYQSWKAAFIACIDNAPATSEYKLLQLRQYLAGEALRVIDNLGHSAIAYEAAKERLERKYGGKRRQIAIYIDELEQFRQVRPGNARDIEQFADLLDIAIINLQEAGQYQELGDGSLYTKLQRKLPESMLARYHRWIYERNKPESVASLRVWVLQEAEFQTIASETVHGVSSKPGNIEPARPFLRPPNQRTFFGGTKGNSNKPIDNMYRQCKVCGLQHAIWMCHDFLKMGVTDRWSTAKRCNLCYRCLGEGHRGKICVRSRPCGLNGCTDVHNRLLHRDVSQPEHRYEPVGPSRNSGGNAQSNNTRGSVRNSHVMEGNYNLYREKPETTMVSQAYIKPDCIGLRTVPVILKNGSRRIQVNALLDDASTKTYVNADVAAELGLRGSTEKVNVNVLNGQVETFETTPINVCLESVDGRVSMQTTAFTANRVTGNMRVIDWNKHAHRWQHLKHIQFPRIESRPIVDVLIGIDCADLHYAINEVRGQPGEPIARLTPLGWTCIGNPDANNNHPLQTNFACTYFVKDQSEIKQLNESIRKFWEIEEVSSTETMPIVKINDQIAMKAVLESMKYEDGMYEVAIPWRKNKQDLQVNYDLALRRLQNTERKLQKIPDLGVAYRQCIDQYIEKGYVKKISEGKTCTSKWYLPHFPIVRPDKDTTKTRIVFDAAAEHDGMSLNDTIYQGPKLQRELFDVLLRFRKYPVAVVCDIAEMYLRIGIAPKDRLYHRFLWRGMDTNRPPDVYEFNRVVFGVNSSPFQAQYVSQQHAQRYKEEFPMAAETVLKSTYMDDSLDSVTDAAQGIELYKQLSQLWAKAGMHARKWMSNSACVLQEIPTGDRKSEVDLDTGPLPCAKTLGVWWQSEEDDFTFKANSPSIDMEYTKRNFLKKIATLFDPLGLLAPFTIRAKIILQDMWTAGMDWDEGLDENLIQSAREWFTELSNLTQIEVPRCLSDTKKILDTLALHTFVDASQYAYGAVIYARCIYQDGSISSTIVAAKTRVAPTIATSIPRLELMGAIVGVRLAISVSKALEININKMEFWSDSVNVLWWIRGKSRDFKPFVANRVGEIQSSTNPDQWRYVPTNVNPADILSRGMKSADLARADMWWQGPQFLRQLENNWPPNKVCSVNEIDKEMKRGMVSQQKTSTNKYPKDGCDVDGTMNCFIGVHEDTKLLAQLNPEQYSNWLKLTRIHAWIKRFVYNCRQSKENRLSGELTSDEMNRSEIDLIKQAQRTEFRDEFTAVANGKQLPSNSKLLGLQPKLDEDGLLRADGRLRYAEFLSYDVRFPVILPRRSWITKLIVKHFHEQGHHASGTNQTLAALSAKYWIISGREVIREWERECAECRRRKAKSCKQIMAPLPVIRLNPSLKAFTRTSVDFGGPFLTVQGRGKRREKRYLCLFTCLATRAVHLEIAFGLDTDSFLNAFYRMASRRGLPEEMLSDNGTNFKGADRELKLLVSQLDPNRIQESTANRGIKWTFNPPLAPHFGGVHETLIKSAKKAIKAILGNADIKDEELMTAIIGAESLMNSRPLTYQSSDPHDQTPLTPNHFLHGQMGGQFASQVVDETAFNPRKRWRRVQELVRHFWHRWIQEWLPGLTARKKWFGTERDIRVGEVVLVMSPDTTRGSWPLGRVIEVFPGQDGHVRVVKIQVGRTTLVRSISKLCPLECDVPVENN